MTWVWIAIAVLGTLLLALAVSVLAAWCDVWRMSERHEERLNELRRELDGRNGPVGERVKEAEHQ